jgi:hypothetical protein
VILCIHNSKFTVHLLIIFRSKPDHNKLRLFLLQAKGRVVPVVNYLNTMH